MARGRNIKPAFFDNDLLADNEPLGRLLFIGMWTIADFKGCFEWREKRIKAKLLPFDNCNVKKLAINLDNSGFIRFYSDGEKTYCEIKNFVKHQNPHKNERDKGSDIPEFNKTMRQAIDLKGLTINPDKNRLNPEDSTSDRAESPILIPESLSLNPDSLNHKPETLKTKSSELNDSINKIFDYWKVTMNKNNSAKLTSARMTKIKARLNDGYTVDQIKEAISGCARSEFHMGKNDNGKKYNDIELICRDGKNIEQFSEKPVIFELQPETNMQIYEREKAAHNHSDFNQDYLEDMGVSNE